MQDDFHDCQLVSGHVGIGHWFHSGKCTHVTACNEIVRRTLESRVHPSLKTISVKYHLRCLNQKVVYKIERFAPGGIGQSPPRTGFAHSCNVGIHERPVEPEANPIECPCGIKMATKRIAVKCNEDYVLKCSQDKLKLGIQFKTNNRLVVE